MTLGLSVTLRNILQSRGLRIVLAESCTAGRVAATLATLPGISQWLCGSFVVYRCSSKTQWLGIPTDMLNDPKIGPVSAPTTLMLAESALRHTLEAEVAVAVTGEIGPGAPQRTDGKVFCALALRDGATSEAVFQLRSPAPQSSDDVVARVERLDEATRLVLGYAIDALSKLTNAH